MGYTTDFEGQFKFDKEVSFKVGKILQNLAETDHRNSVGKPGFYCQWVLSDDGMALEWDGNEKFYDYVEWLKYIIDEIVEPNGYKLNGEVYWYGEDHKDTGLIVVKDNKVTVKRGQVVYK